MSNIDIFNFFVEKKEQSDGGLESLLSIIKYYNKDLSNVNPKNIIYTNYQSTSFVALRLAAEKFGLDSVLCTDVDLNSIIEYNKPIIINISQFEKATHYVVCYGINNKEEFIIGDPANGIYTSSKNGFMDMWKNNKCLAFIEN